MSYLARHPEMQASIRPRLRSRGDAVMVRDGRLAVAASIRPRLRSRGDVEALVADQEARLALQFGHGCGAVEIR